MKLTQSELDTLPAFQSQLTDIRNQLKTFDLQVDEDRASRGFRSDLQKDFQTMHNGLSSIISTMEKQINNGAR